VLFIGRFAKLDFTVLLHGWCNRKFYVEVIKPTMLLHRLLVLLISCC